MKKKLIYGFLLLTASVITACTNATDYDLENPESQKVIFTETFESGTLGDFTTQSVTGDQVWVGDARGYAFMTGYVSATRENIANEDWLISPQINLTDVTTAHFTFEHVARYFADLVNEATVWISDNYVSGAPSTATWTQVVTSPFRDPGAWDFQPSGQLSLTAYAGKKIHIAFKYISTNTKAGSWEIKNMVVATGEAVNENVNYGLGTAASPYSVLGGTYNQNNTSAWLKGTIVGYVWYVAGKGNSFYFSGDTCTQATNILVADSGSLYLSQAMAVQLPAGAVRTGINLKDNKSLYGKKVILYGDLTAYFGIAGLKNTSYYKLEDGTTGGNKPFDPSSAIYYETFATNLGKFTTQNVTGGEIWTYNGTYKCAYMTGFVSSQNRANEDWLISPEIDLTGKSDIALAFDHVFRYGGEPANEATVWVSENYSSGLPATATWTQITTNFTNASTWDFYNTGDISLKAYAGKKIKIALVYKSTSTKAGTWEVKNFIVK